MIRFFSVMILSIFLPLSFVYAEGVDESGIFQGIVKIKTYRQEKQSNSYEFSHFGSAVLIGKNRIITNAHVIMDRDRDMPTGYYEVCVSRGFMNIPECSTEARLIAYDETLDLALLETKDPISNHSIIMSDIGVLNMGQTAIIYGYPMIGGDTITRTEGKIAGFTAGVYKIDGSIDHGNSGGGAFDVNQKLIGIPFAVSADNGVIGYMIPQESIAKFLSSKSDAYEFVGAKWDKEFIAYMETLHSSRSGTRLLSGSRVQFPDGETYGLSVRDNFITADQSAFGWIFSNANNRVNIYFSCSQDAGVKKGYEFERDAINANFLSNGLISATYSGSRNQFYRVERNTVQKKTGESGYSLVWFYTHYDSCMAEVYPTDAKKDKKALQQAEAFLAQVQLPKKYTLSSSQKNSFFEIFHIFSAARVSKYVDGSGLPQVQIQFQLPNKNRISEKIQYGKYDERNEYFMKPFDEVSDYTGTLSIGALRDQFRDQLENTETKIHTTGDGKKFIFSYNVSSDHILSINFYYPYQLNGEYLYWYWTTKIEQASLSDVSLIENFFLSLSLPGDTPF